MANLYGTVYASAARTSDPTAVDIQMRGHRGIRIQINATAKGAAPSVVPAIKVKDQLSGVYTAVLTGAAIVTAAPTHVELVVYPSITAAANLAASMALSSTVQVTMTHGNSDSLTYSVAYELLP